MLRYRFNAITSAFAKNGNQNKCVSADTLCASSFTTIIIVGMVYAPIASAANSTVYFYRVKEKDALSNILWNCGIAPLYGKKGSLRVVLAANPRLAQNGGNRVYPGEIIYIPMAQVPPLAQILPNGELIPVEVKPPQRTLASNPAQEGLQSIAPSPPPLDASDAVIHEFVFGTNYQFESLMMTDASTQAKAQLYTNSDVGLNVSFRQAWSSRIKTYFKFALEKLTFAPSGNALKTIANPEVTKTAFSLGLAQQWTDSLSLRYSVGYGSELFIRGQNSSSITIDQKPLPQVGLEAQFNLLDRGNTRLGTNAQANYLASGSTENYSIQSGYRLGLGTYLLYQNQEGKTYGLNVGYQTRAQNTSLGKTTENVLQAEISFGLIPFKDSR